MGVSEKNLAKAQPKDIFCVTRHEIFFFDENNCFATSRQMWDWSYSEAFIKAVNQVAKSRMIEAGYAWQNSYIIDESSFACLILDPLVGLPQDVFFAELEQRGNHSLQKRKKIRGEADYEAYCRENFSALFAKTGLSVLSIKPMLDVRSESFELSFNLRRYACEESTTPISVKEYGQWLKQRKTDFFSFVKAQIEHFEYIKWRIGDISYYRLTDCVVKADSTITLIFSVKPELAQILEDEVSD